MRIALIEIGHDTGKPPVCGESTVSLCAVRICETSDLERCLHILGTVVEPVVRGLVCEKETLVSAMVEHHVHNQFDSFGPGMVGQPDQIFR